MNFNQYIHTERESRALYFASGAVVDGRHDNQNAVSPERARLHDLIGLVDEVFSQDGQRSGVASQC